MQKLRVHNVSVSLDGYAAGPEQTLSKPIGVGGENLHRWMIVTRTFAEMVGREGGDTGQDDDITKQGDVNIGASIMGRNMFGPIRGEWPDLTWTGWWGPEPPYHHPVFVLTHHPRPSIPMEGGTVFHFVTDGPESALEQAFAAADGQDVRIGGGASTIQQYLRAGLVDEMHLAIVPILLGSGERLFDNLGAGPVGYRCTGWEASPSAMHVHFARTEG